jgi:YidC/Oxa1 family membrane protein insertase
MIVLMSASQFITQRQLMLKNTDPAAMAGNPFAQQQKILMYVFPVMFAVFGINFPVGVLVYWLTTNVWTMGQQLYVINRNPTPGSIAYQARQKRLAEKAKKKGKVLLPDGTMITQEEFDAREAEEKARAARRVQPTRTTKAKRKGGAQRPADQESGPVKGSTVRTPPGANGTTVNGTAHESTGAGPEDDGTAEDAGPGEAAGAGSGAGSGGSRSGGRQQPRNQSRARRNQGRKKS